NVGAELSTVMNSVEKDIPEEFTHCGLALQLVVDEKLRRLLPAYIVHPSQTVVQRSGVLLKCSQDGVRVRRRRHRLPVHPSAINQIAAGLGLQRERPHHVSGGG